MIKPAHTFRIVVQPTYTVFGCQVKRDEEARGLYGFHAVDRCSQCERRFDGWQFWGENGHMQGAAHTREHLIHWLKVKARTQWEASGQQYQPKGSRIGFRFELGPAIHYRG